MPKASPGAFLPERHTPGALRDAYVTDAVKHFKWEARGKRCIHKQPSSASDRVLPPIVRS